jgi:hypothetical protein
VGRERGHTRDRQSHSRLGTTVSPPAVPARRRSAHQHTGMSADERNEVPRAAVGAASLDAVRAAKVLVVGAGGIGCELLKNLVLSGFTNIEVIDLDTIDVSNLNRQFLFRKKDVGKPKSQVAAEVVRQFNPHCQITHYCDNVKKPQYGVSFVSKFDIVLNALDNLSARRHVNRICLAAGKPLVESGTTGYLGQVSRELACLSPYLCSSTRLESVMSLGQSEHVRRRGMCTWRWGRCLASLGLSAPSWRDGVLRVHGEAHAEAVPYLHACVHTEQADPPCALGQDGLRDLLRRARPGERAELPVRGVGG